MVILLKRAFLGGSLIQHNPAVVALIDGPRKKNMALLPVNREGKTLLFL
jgi:hypothetical protein